MPAMRTMHRMFRNQTLIAQGPSPGGAASITARLEAMRASGMSATAIRRALALSEMKAVACGLVVPASARPASCRPAARVGGAGARQTRTNTARVGWADRRVRLGVGPAPPLELRLFLDLVGGENLGGNASWDNGLELVAIANAASMTAVAPPPGIPSARSVAIEPASEVLFAASEATTPAGLPLPKESGSASLFLVAM